MDIISSLSTIEKVEGKSGADMAREIIAASMDKIQTFTKAINEKLDHKESESANNKE